MKQIVHVGMKVGNIYVHSKKRIFDQFSVSKLIFYFDFFSFRDAQRYCHCKIFLRLRFQSFLFFARLCSGYFLRDSVTSLFLSNLGEWRCRMRECRTCIQNPKMQNQGNQKMGMQSPDNQNMKIGNSGMGHMGIRPQNPNLI